MSTVGGYLEHRRGVQYRGGYLEYREDIMSTVGVFSTVGGYHPLKFEYRGGYYDTCGGYHEYSGCSVPWGTQITKDFSNFQNHEKVSEMIVTALYTCL